MQVFATCRAWMGMEQRPQLFRWQTASTVAALPNNINRLSKSCCDTENRTWNTPASDTHTHTQRM